MAKSRSVGKLWYLLVLVPLAIGALVTTRGITGLFDSVEHMPRVVVPGKGEMTLEAGNYVLYAEEESHYRGVVYVAQSLHLRCAMTDPQGVAVELKPASFNSNYHIGAYSGRSIFELTIPRAGTYHLDCAGDDGPATLAAGQGFLSRILEIVFGAVGALLGAGATVLIVSLVQRRSRSAGA